MKIFKSFTIFSIISLSILTVGCNGTYKPHLNPRVEKLRQVASDVRSHSKEIKEETKYIRLQKKEIENKLPEEVREPIQPNLNNIEESTVKIEESETKIAATVPIVVEEAYADVKNVVKERDDYKDKYEEQKRQNESGIRTFVLWVAGLCFIGLAGSIGAYFFLPSGTRKLAGVAIVAFGGLMALAIAVNTFYKEIAYAGLAILVGLVGLLIYIIYKKIKENKKGNDLNKKMVQLFEIMKYKLDNIGSEGEKLRKEFFGSGPDPNGIAYHILSEEEDKLIKELRRSDDIKLAK